MGLRGPLCRPDPLDPASRHLVARYTSSRMIAPATSRPVTGAGRGRWQPRWVDAFALGSAFVALTAWSWRKWPDVLIDFGRELYTPWQLAQGAVLYRDVASLFGPFSQYFNAALFGIFGTSYTTLIVANLGILAALCLLVYRFFAASCDRLTAVVAVAVLLPLFGFAGSRLGSFNFVAPYAHEATHGLVLSVLMLYGGQRFIATGRVRWAALAGGCLGLVMLTKPEISAAAAAAALCGVLLVVRVPALAPLGSWQAVGTFSAALVAGPLAFLAYFLTRVPAEDAVRAVLGAWTPILKTAAASNAFYAHKSGLDAPISNLLEMGRMSMVVAAIATIWVAVDRAASKRRTGVRSIAVVSSMVFLAICLAVPFSWFDWFNTGRILPVLVVVAIAVLGTRVMKDAANEEKVKRLVPLVLWAVLALGLLAKVILNVHLYDYGFVLAFPATLIGVATAVSLVPTALRIRRGSGIVFRSLALTYISVLVVAHLISSHVAHAAKTFPVGNGGDRMWTYEPPVSPIGPLIAQALEHIERLVPPNGTLLVLPEGVTLNYLVRRQSPTPYINFMLPELAAFGEESILSALEQHPPDLVVLAHKDTSEYGVGFFGADPQYGRAIMSWVSRHYEPAALIGAEPLRSDAFGIKILRRRGT